MNRDYLRATAIKYQAHAKPKQNESNQYGKSNFLEKVFQAIHIVLIVTTKLLIKTFSNKTF
jgi:hypothetical protein